MPNLFADGYNHETESWRERTAHGASTALTNTSLTQCEGLHVQRWFYQVWNISDDDFPSDIETTGRASFDDVTRVVGFAWVDREGFSVKDIHLGPKEVKEHKPGSDEPVLVNTGEETGKILIDQDQLCVDRCRF